MHSDFESRRMAHEIIDDSRVIKLSTSFSFTARFSTLSEWLYVPDPRSPQPDLIPLPCHLEDRSQMAPSYQVASFWQVTPDCLPVPWPFRSWKYLLPGTSNQSYATTLIYFSTSSRHQIYVVSNDDLSTSNNTRVRMFIFQQPKYIHIHQTQDLLLTTSDDLNPIQSTFPRDQWSRIISLTTFHFSFFIDNQLSNSYNIGPSCVLVLNTVFNTQKQ